MRPFDREKIKDQNIYVSQTREYVTKTYRPLPESGLNEFGEWICTEGWGDILENTTPTEQVLAFEKLVTSKMDTILPQKTVKINPNFDKPYITAELKKLDRQIKREYRKRCQSAKYQRLKNSYDAKLLIAAESYLGKKCKVSEGR